MTVDELIKRLNEFKKTYDCADRHVEIMFEDPDSGVQYQFEARDMAICNRYVVIIGPENYV